MPFFSDNYTAESDTTLASRVPDIGTGYTRIWSDGSNPTFTVNAANDDLRGTTAANSGCIYTLDVATPSADYDFVFTLKAVVGFSERPLYVGLRCADQDNFYAVRLTNVANGGQLYKKVGGSMSAIGSAFSCPAAGSVCKLEMIGSTLKFYDDGVEVASATGQTDLTAAGKGMYALGGGAELLASTDDANSGWQIDSIALTDLATGLSGTINQATETDTAQALSRSKILAIAQTTETDQAQAFSVIKIRTIAQAEETDQAQALSRSKILVIAQAEETDQAQALSVIKIRTIAQAEELDQAQAVTNPNAPVIGQAEETDTAQALSRSKIRTIAQAEETDQAQPFSRVKLVLISQVSETDLAQALFPNKQLLIAQALEVDAAQALSGSKIRTIGQAEELDLALAIEVGGVGTEFHRNRQVQPMFDSISPLGS